MVRVDAWCGDKVRSRLCVRQLKEEQQREVTFAGTPAKILHKIPEHWSCIGEVLGNFDTAHQRSVHARSVKRGKQC